MLALVFDDQPRLVERPMPTPAKGEALVRVLAAGVCNTDLEIVRGYMGFRGILGHEFVGIVEHATNAHLVGRRVVGEINCACGSCRYCQLEMKRHCTQRTVLGILGRDGAFAEYLTLPEENLHLVPNNIRDDVAVFTEPVAAAFRILEQVNISPDDRVLVLGDGKLAQLIAQVLWLRSKNLVCIGHHPEKLGLLEHLRIATALDADMLDTGADVVVEATGSASGFQRAMELVRPEGTIVLKSTLADTGNVDFNLPVINEIRIIGSRCGPFRPALEALALGNVEVRPLITETYALSDGVQALAHADEPGALKIVLKMA